MSDKPYKLSASLYGHSLDVRSLAVTSDNFILSGSRDKTAKLWKPNGFNTSYTESITYREQKNYVGSVLFLEPSEEFSEGLIVTGGNDSTIFIYKPHEPFATFKLQEHSNAVSCLSKGVVPNTFLSGSWDATAKFWNINESKSSISTFSGHGAAIWSVLQVQDSRVITASADKMIWIWAINGTVLKKLEGHTDCVRGLCDISDLGYFISISNDASIKTWTYAGENLETLYGHTNYIYGIARCKALGPSSFVTSDEDRSVRVWENGVNTQTFQLPAQSVWTIKCLNNGDIVTGSSDGVVRIFTQDENRYADPSLLSTYDEEVAALTVHSSQQIGGVKISDLRGPEALHEPGKRPGQMIMIREASGVKAYTWIEDGANSHWEQMGDVVGANDKSQEGKTLFEGKQYDFVFSVDVEDGKPPLKLPYNKGDDPYQTAHAFLAKNNLPAEYLDQVVDFILKNSKQQENSAPTTADYVDPFTGASRYTPASASNAQQFQGANLDPFTGSSSYSTGGVGSGGSTLTAHINLGSQAQNGNTYFPQKVYLSFEMGNAAVILNKLKEFNREVGDGNNRLNEKSLEDFVTLCDSPPQDPNILDILFKLLKWPETILFPVLDVVRLAVRFEQTNEIIANINKQMLMEKLVCYISESCSIPNNTIVALRTLTNFCLHPPGENVVFESRFDIVENITSLGSLNKNGQIALATLLLNMTVLCQKKNDDVGLTVLADVLQDILTKLSDPEAQFRTYVALGTLITANSPESREVKIKLKTNASFLDIMDEHISSFNSELERKRMNCAKDLKTNL